MAKLLSNNGLEKKPVNLQGIKLSNRIRLLILTIFFSSIVYSIFIISQSTNIFYEWQKQKHEEFLVAVNEIVQEKKLKINFSSLAIVPLKVNIAQFIENDQTSSIHILLDDIKNYYKVDTVILKDDTGRVYANKETYQQPSKRDLNFLSTVSVTADVYLFSQKHIKNLTGVDFLALELGHIYVAMKVPISFDEGSFAGEIFLINQVFVRDSEKLSYGVLENVQSFNFISKNLQNNLTTNLDLNLFELIDALFINEELIFKIPVVNSMLDEYLGAVKINIATHEIKKTFILQFLMSVLPVIFLLLMFLYFYRLLRNRMIIPVEKIAGVAEQILQGHMQVRLTFMDNINPLKRSEVDNLGERFNLLIDVLEQKQTALKNANVGLEKLVIKRTEALVDANDELQKIAHTDALTRIDNRHGFEVYWKKVRKQVQQDKLKEVVFCILDCDHFKSFNDTYGHQVGDKVLKSVAEKITKVVAKHGRFFRLGGDEFAIIFENKSINQAQKIMKKLVKEVANFPTSSINVQEPLSISIGLSYYGEHDKFNFNPTSIIRNADIAMYIAKTSLDSKTIVFDPVKHSATSEELKLENVNKLLEMVKTGEGLELYFQPIFSLDTQKIDYFEILSRLNINGEIIYPNIFMAIVERTGMMVQFDKMVIQKSFEALQAGLVNKGSGISVNLSAEAILTKGVLGWFDQFIPLLKDYKVVIEITETTLITQLDKVSNIIEKFKSKGFKVALDDFGSGYSSISYLAYLPVNIIKFDISLARAAFQKSRTAKVIEGLILDLSEMGYSIVIEGIEDKEMYEMLSLMNPSHFQGYYINRPNPIPNNSVSHFLENVSL